MPDVIEKRKVTMLNVVAINGDIYQHKAEDFVPVEILDAYVADAQTRWQSVVVDHDSGHDSGPAGDAGDTHFPAHLDHPNCNGQTVSGVVA